MAFSDRFVAGVLKMTGKVYVRVDVRCQLQILIYDSVMSLVKVMSDVARTTEERKENK